MEAAALGSSSSAPPRWDARRFPPAPRAPKLVQTARLGRDPLGYMLAQREVLGPVFSLRIYPYSAFVCVTDPQTNREVLTDQQRFRGGDAADLLLPLVGAGSLICTPPPAHLRNRKLLLPPFHGERVARWGERMRELVVAEIERLPHGRPVAIRPVALRLTLDVILRLVFGVRDPGRVAAFRSALDRLMSRAMQVLLFARPLQRELGRWSPGSVFARRRAVVDALIRDEITARRADPGSAQRDDVLSILLEGRDDEGRGLSDGELRDELMGLVLAGHETTATALAWTLHLLAQNPAARDELVAALDGGDGDDLLKATIKESMRLRAPVLDAVRIAEHDTELGGQPVPRGAFISAMFCVTHLAPELWDEPQAFRPARHLAGRAVPYSWTPFGGGVRRCLGASLAQLELEVAVREVLARAIPEAADGLEAARLHGVTIIPARGGRIVLRPR